MALVNSLQDGMNFFLNILATLPAPILSLIIFVLGFEIIILLAKKVTS